MFRLRKNLGEDSDWRISSLAGLLGFALTAAAMEIVSAYSVPLTTSSIILSAVIGSLLGMSLVAQRSALCVRHKLHEQNKWLDGAINNMIQGLCMFNAQNRLMVWNERYRAMYNIDPRSIWRGCTVQDLLGARIAAGTFPLNPERYEAQLRAALKQDKPFTHTVDLSDGRTVAVVNQPMQGGGWVATHEDITERRRAERELDRTRTFLDTIINNVPSNIIVKELPSLRYLLINKAGEKHFDLPRENMIGRTTAEIFSKGTADLIHQHDLEFLRSGREIISGEHAIITPTGNTRIVTTTRLPVMGEDGRPQYMIVVIDDLTERKRHEQRIVHMAHHDSLTELPNRAAFNECIGATLELAARAGESFAVLCVDLDRFKEVNDVFGYSVGDALLCEAARRLETACQGAFLARVGGDEFSIITPTGLQPATAVILAEQLVAAFDSDIDIEGHPLRVGLTIGVGIYPQDGADAATLIANTDAALSRAKSEARGSIRFFETSMDHQLREKRALQQDLRNAIMRDEIALHYQPQAHIAGDITGFEALVRWHHPRHGLVPPTTFIPLAEESGIIIALGEWVLRSACREAASWPRPLSIAINLSPVQFQHGDLPSLVHQILLETGLPPARLELEITEGVLIGDFTRAVAILRRLKNLGVRIAMDDFGTGYSSLSYLQSFPFDKIKIDRSFIASLNQSQQAATIIRAVIALGRGLDLPVVAEGVETEEQLKFLASESCDEIQGYLIGRPTPIADYADVVGRAPAPWPKDLAAAS
ncbi:MAG: EAL domain-containing protein [Rhizobiales bacterium]|nr:EAL domain-containing protein [Hyphomicrobiales bacterium]